MTDSKSRETREPVPSEDRRYRALASAVHFLDAARRELPVLMERVRQQGLEVTGPDLDHLIDGLGSVLRLVIELDAPRAGSGTARAAGLGSLPRVLRDMSAARRDGENDVLSDLLGGLGEELHRCRHLVGARLESLDESQRA